MQVLLRIVIFTLVVICGFAGYTTFGLPLIVPALPPVEEKLTGNITMEQYIAMGNKIFHGKGTCTLCHNPVGGRAPVLEPVAQNAPDRLKDPRYKGKATTIEEYIHESMIEPSAYVVAGFGKKGTNDTVSPMPNISKGAIGLNDVEIGAVISYLQNIGGVDVTVALPSVDDSATAGGGDGEPAEIQVAKTPAEAFDKFGCGTCHLHPLIKEGGDLGPDLANLPKVAGKRKKGMTAEQYVIESILKPNAYVAKDFEPDTMPDDFATQMTVAELDMIVNALLGKKVSKG